MKPRLPLTIFSGLCGLEALMAVLWSGSMPAEAGNALAFGYSLPRLLLMGGMVVIGAGLLVLAWMGQRTPEFSRRLAKRLARREIGIVTVLIVLAAWVLTFSPAYQWGRFGGYKDRLLPFITWLLLVGLQTTLLNIWSGRNQREISLRSILTGDRGLIKAWWISLGVFTLGLLLVSVFRVGLIPDIVYWNDTNVPLLGIQIIGVVSVSMFVLFIFAKTGFFAGEKKTRFQRILPDVLICLFIWGLAVAAWTQVDMPHSYFAPGPYPPNQEMYPFSDAAGYDRLAQTAVIGEGLGSKTREYVDKPLYVAFLAAIHMLVGNRMDPVVGTQAAVIALLPVLIYLIGKKLHSRLAGVMAAGLMIVREVNNIQGTLWVLSSNTRVLMSESLVMLLLGLFTLMLLSWFQAKRNTLYLIAAGGSLGLAALVRLNPLLLMPIALAAIFLSCGKRWKQGLVNSLVFAAMFIGTLFPWMLQSYDRHDKLFYFSSAMSGVVLTQRTYYALNNPTPAPTLEPSQPTPQPAAPPQPVNKTWNRITGVSRYVSAHFFHNLISGMALFPTSLTLDSLEKTIKNPGSYWSAAWDGELSAGQIGLVYLGFMVLSLGLAAGWSRRHWAGLVPAGFLIAYSLATAVARTSGGRYILPADWVFLVYFAIGLAQIVDWITTWLRTERLESVVKRPDTPDATSTGRWPIGAIAVLFILVGAAPAIMDRVIPRWYQPVEKQTLAAELQRQGKLDDLGISQNELEEFLQLPDAVVTQGRGLYPRYYAQNQGEPDRFSPMRGQAFPRLVMEIIGAEKPASGVLPLLKSPGDLLNGADVLAIGCRGELNDDWLALVAGDQVYLRSPATEWTCPASLPVCDDNHNCR